MTQVMLDLETMGNTPNAAIIAIGAVKFNKDCVLPDKFYRVVDLESSVRLGGKIDSSTVLWWMQQDQAARDAFKQEGEHILQVLADFTEWLDCDNAEVWGNGVAFDNVILASAYRNAHLQVPWKFWNDRCYRTMKSLYPNVKMDRVGTHHNAVNDAESQALHLIEIFKYMETK